MLRDSSRLQGNFEGTVETAGLNLRQAYYLCASWIGFDHLPAERFKAMSWTKTQVITQRAR